MVDGNYDPRKDPASSEYERRMYEFFESCVINGRYRDGLVVLRTDNTLPSYFKDQFQGVMEEKIKEGEQARKNLRRKLRFS